VIPGPGRIDIDRGRRDVEVSGQDHREPGFEEFAGVRGETLEPFEFVVEFRPGLRIAIGQINAADHDTADRCFDVTRLRVSGVAGQGGLRHNRFTVARQDGDAVPGLLAAPDRVVASLAQRRHREVGIGTFELLQAHDVRPGFLQPSQQVGQPAIDVVDIEGGNFHDKSFEPPARAGTTVPLPHWMRTCTRSCSASPKPDMPGRTT
jgi:hypothetical protein